MNMRAMEIFRSIGTDAAFIEAGSSIAPSQGIFYGKSLFEVIEPMKRRTEKDGDQVRKTGNAMGGLIKRLSETISPVQGARCTQDMLEPVLVKIARKRGGELLFNTSCEMISQDGTSVTVTLLDRAAGTTKTVKADYLIAADGAGSPIRKSLSIGLTGAGVLGNLLNILFKADLTSFVKGREISICRIEHPKVRGVFTSIDNRESWVFHLSYEPSKGEKASDFTPERCQELLRFAIGIPDLKIEITSIMPWQPSDVCAEKFQEGRVFLAGDAAKQCTPYAGQGATSGISDVHNLSWKLAMVFNHQAPPKLLESYEAERLPVDRFVAHESGVITDGYGLPDMKYGKATWIYNAVSRIPMYSGFGYTYTRGAIIPEPSPASWLASFLAKWFWFFFVPWTIPSLILGLNGKPGTRAPHVWLQHPEKGRISTLDLFGKSFVILTGSQGKEWCTAADEVKEKMHINLGNYRIGPTGNLTDPEKRWEGAAGISSRGVLLVRPDGFVAWRAQDQEGNLHEKLQEVMEKILCR